MRCVAAGLAVACAVLASAVPVHAGRKQLGAVTPPVRLVPHGETITVHGLHDYFGAIEVAAFSDGLAVSNHLSLERYLLGLNEVPTSWPTEALRAQAVAARTYALWTLGRPREGLASVYGFDICATIQCQVFSGADVVQLDTGARWAAAVNDTAGTAILYDGQPILARYHSTSGGTTFDNEDAFTDEPAYPYLKAVTSTTETTSPVYRWRVVFTLKRLQRMLERAGVWRGPIRSVVTVESNSGSPYPDVVVTGPRRRKRMIADHLRDAVRETAPAMFPSLYPSPWHTTSGRLPETLPSERFVISTKNKKVVVNGRGWGHGVGMSQWGAHGLAQEGATFDQILLHYYTGVSLGRIDTSPPIEVGVASARPAVTVTGAFSIVDGEGDTVVDDALGTWTFRDAGGAVAVDPPRGFGLPLKVGIVNAPKRVDVGEPAFLTVALSRPANVRAETVGMPERNPKLKVKSAGKRRVTWLAPLEEGRYRVRVRAATKSGQRYSKTVPIVVSEAPLVQPEADLRGDARAVGDDASVWRYTAVFAGVLVLLVLVAALVLARRRREVPGTKAPEE